MSDENDHRPNKGINIMFGGPPMPSNHQTSPMLNEPPARVRMAMDFSLTMAKRASPMIAVNELRIEEIQPAKLTTHEHAAWNAACVALTDYFNGSLDLDVFEDALVDGIEVETTRRRMGQRMICGVCHGEKVLLDNDKQQRTCGLCEGAGMILVIPQFGFDERDEGEPANG
jgi:hypothetical protein